MKLDERTPDVEPGSGTAATGPLIRLASVPGPLGPLLSAARDTRPTVADGLELAERMAADLGRASTRDLWEALATVAATDLGAARAAEPHLDAAGILDEAGLPLPSGRYGVFAAEGGGDPLVAEEADAGWTLTGTKPWCSLAGSLDRALVTARSPDGARRLFDVGLRSGGVTVDPSAWVARGLTEIPSGPVRFDHVIAVPVGGPGWYLERPGFARGGIGVSACWFGGAVAIGRTVHAAAAAKTTPILSAHLGAIDVALQDARRALDEAATLIDDRAEIDPSLLAKRVRTSVVDACEEVLLRAGHALGPAPLALDAAHAKRVADLQLYIRQHHAEVDLASLGDDLAAQSTPW